MSGGYKPFFDDTMPRVFDDGRAGDVDCQQWSVEVFKHRMTKCIGVIKHSIEDLVAAGGDRDRDCQRVRTELHDWMEEASGALSVVAARDTDFKLSLIHI